MLYIHVFSLNCISHSIKESRRTYVEHCTGPLILKRDEIYIDVRKYLIKK